MVSVAVGLGAHLGGEGEGDLLAVGLAEDDLGLLDGLSAVLELGEGDALLDLDVLADDLGDLKGDVDALLPRLGDVAVDLDGEGLVDLGDAVGLGLVLLPAVLVLAMGLLVGAVGRVGLLVARGGARGDLHRLGLVLVGDL